MRDVEPVVSAEAEEEVVARDARNFLRLEAEQLADAVVFVDDVVARAQVGERLECASADAALARRPLAEDLRVGQQHEPEVTPDEAAACGGDCEEELGIARKLLPLLEQARVGATQQVLLAQRLAEVREGDDDAVARANERVQLVLRLGQSARNECRPLRLEGERLPGRQRVQ